jgi:hypothetical protein
LIRIAAAYPDIAMQASSTRPLLVAAQSANRHRLESELAAEEQQERKADRQYWQPLKQELERLRHERRREQ